MTNSNATTTENSSAGNSPDLLPVRMLNEFAYCPRLFHLRHVIRAYETRLDQLVTHPIFDYRCSWRSIIRLQARLLARWLRGDVPEYTGMVTR
ncbi:MAG: hypothetical protein GWP05_06570 [Anaerolineaceae bacterium]|nr:hypothetical protein [Anaerolineaceae bacterium]